MHALIWLGLFVAALLSDVCWAMWSLEVNRHHAVRAGLWSAAIALCGIVFFSGYLSSRWNVIPVMFGAGAGTTFTVWRHGRKSQPH